MGNILTAAKVKKLPPGTDIRIVNDETGDYGLVWIIKNGRKKMLKGIATVHEIIDRDGWHYELEED